jgi:hypothetical protein
MTSIYLEHFKQQVLNTVPLKLAYWYKYGDDTFVVWRTTEIPETPQ